MAKSKLTKSEVSNISYIGNGAYCYANSAAMLLASIGEEIFSSIIEVLTGIGLSAFFMEKNNLLFFSFALPDEELSRALKILGFNCKERIVPKTELVPITKLKEDLQKSPIILGPLDMGYLVYNPKNQSLGGSDHFVLVYGADNKVIYLHDPAGFPCVFLSYQQLKLAWKSKKIFYGLDNYHYWTAPERIKTPSKKDIYSQAIKDFKAIYQACKEKSAENNWTVGKEAILACADRFQNQKATKQEIDHLVYFALPLGAKRAFDFAYFFDFRDDDLAALKREQAKLFGRCHTLAVAQDWFPLAKALKKLAEIEKEFRIQLLNKK